MLKLDIACMTAGNNISWQLKTISLISTHNRKTNTSVLLDQRNFSLTNTGGFGLFEFANILGSTFRAEFFKELIFRISNLLIVFEWTH